MKDTPLAARFLPLLALALSCCAAAPDHAQRVDNETVSYETREASGATMLLRGVLWYPAAEPKGVVILVHGSGGMRGHPVDHYARELSFAGYLALAIDSFRPRDIEDTIDDQTRISALQMARDAFAALQALGARGYRIDRAAILGFSKGGTAALYAADRNFLPGQTQRFRAALAFYPDCSVRPRAPQPASTLYVALAAEDDYVSTPACTDLANAYAAAGGSATVKVYPGAAHGFDGDPERTQLTYLPRADNYRDCLVYLDSDGRFDYRGTTYAADDAALIADLRRTCMKRGASVWTHPRQKAAATRDVIEFLDRTLAR